MIEMMTAASSLPTEKLTVVSWDSNVEHIGIVTDKGNLYFYGANAAGGMGSGDTTSPTGWYKSPVSDVQDLWKNSSSLSIIRKKDNSIWAAGRIINQYQLGYNYGSSNVVISTFLDITSYLPVTSDQVKYIRPGYASMALVTNDGRLFWTGANTSSHHGDGTSTAKTVWTQVTTTTPVVDIYVIGSGAATDQTSIYVDASGIAYGSGSATYYIIGGTAYSTYTRFANTLLFRKIWMGAQNMCYESASTLDGPWTLRFAGNNSVYGGSGSLTTNFALSSSSYSNYSVAMCTTAANVGAIMVSRQLTSSGVVNAASGGTTNQTNITQSNTAAAGFLTKPNYPPSTESNTNASLELFRISSRSVGVIYRDSAGTRIYGVGTFFGQAVNNVAAPFVTLALPNDS